MLILSGIWKLIVNPRVNTSIFSNSIPEFHLVLEIVLQCHPNHVSISEDYVVSGKTLHDVLTNTTDCVFQSAELKKNFGVVLVPDCVLEYLPEFQQLFLELKLLKKVESTEGKQQADSQLVKFCETTSQSYSSKLTPWSYSLLKSVPEGF